MFSEINTTNYSKKEYIVQGQINNFSKFFPQRITTHNPTTHIAWSKDKSVRNASVGNLIEMPAAYARHCTPRTHERANQLALPAVWLDKSSLAKIKK